MVLGSSRPSSVDAWRRPRSGVRTERVEPAASSELRAASVSVCAAADFHQDEVTVLGVEVGARPRVGERGDPPGTYNVRAGPTALEFEEEPPAPCVTGFGHAGELAKEANQVAPHRQRDGLEEGAEGDLAVREDTQATAEGGGRGVAAV
eukprot:jgi/Tetstr1/455508/TSEL_042335.t1